MKLLFYVLFSISFLFVFSCKEDSNIEVSKSTKHTEKIKKSSEKSTAKKKIITSSTSDSETIKVKSKEEKPEAPRIKERVFESPENNDVEKKVQNIKKIDQKPVKAVKPKKKKVRPTKVKPIAEGNLQFNSSSYDFGFIDMGKTIDHSFYFKNSGNKAVNISNATATCGCTTPVFPFLPIEPGETGKIDVRFNSKGRLGPQSAKVTVYSDANSPEIELIITGTVRTEIIKPSEVIDTSKN